MFSPLLQRGRPEGLNSEHGQSRRRTKAFVFKRENVKVVNVQGLLFLRENFRAHAVPLLVIPLRTDFSPMIVTFFP